MQGIIVDSEYLSTYNVDTIGGYYKICLMSFTDKKGKHADGDKDFYKCDELDCCYTHWSVQKFPTGSDVPTKVYFTKTPAAFTVDIDEEKQTVSMECKQCQNCCDLDEYDYTFSDSLSKIVNILEQVNAHVHGVKRVSGGVPVKYFAGIMTHESKSWNIETVFILGQWHTSMTDDAIVEICSDMTGITTEHIKR